jgi:hypothetical protein
MKKRFNILLFLIVLQSGYVNAFPETFWNQDNSKYNDYPLHTPGTVAGVSDGAIEEVLSIPLLVKFGVEVITDKEMAKGLWESVKNINVESIKNAAVDFYDKKKDQYTSNKPYIVGHAAGYDAVQVATMVFGVGPIFTKGSKEALEKGMKETGDVIKKEANAFEEIWKLSKQKLGRAADSKVLGDNLEAVGKIRPDNAAAHHIVAGGENYINAEAAREILKKADIDINEAANGVFLPKGSKYVIDESIAHTKVHTHSYYDNLLIRLQNSSPNKIREELQRISEELLTGTFPY